MIITTRQLKNLIGEALSEIRFRRDRRWRPIAGSGERSTDYLERHTVDPDEDFWEDDEHIPFPGLDQQGLRAMKDRAAEVDTEDPTRGGLTLSDMTDDDEEDIEFAKDKENIRNYGLDENKHMSEEALKKGLRALIREVIRRHKA